MIPLHYPSSLYSLSLTHTHPLFFVSSPRPLNSFTLQRRRRRAENREHTAAKRADSGRKVVEEEPLLL